MSAQLLKSATRKCSAPRGGLRVLAVAKPSPKVAVKASQDDQQMQAMKTVALTGVIGNMFMAGQAEAAQQVAEIAGDNRLGVLAALFLPALGWVGFNILGPALNQVNDMSEKNQKGVAIGAGLGLASLLAAGNAEAAQQVAEIAGDNRLGVLAALFLPALGWVGFNILGPALNQVSDMSEKNQRGVVVGAGLGLASLLAAGNAEAAQQVAEIAGDNRLGVLAALFLPALGWVGFNILGPALNQVNDMSEKNQKGVAIGAGLGLASLLAAGNAEAAQQVAEIAGDNRLGVLAALFLPALGWVGFNILGPALNQVNDMSEKNQKGVAIGAGVGLASLLAAGNAEAAQQVAEIAGDNRLGVLAALFLPALGWVGFNILGPALNQVNDMSEKNQK